MNDVVWKVKVEKGWRDLEFAFGSAEEAESFASIMCGHYVPDDDKFSVSVSAEFAKNILAEKKEDEE